MCIKAEGRVGTKPFSLKGGVGMVWNPGLI